MDNVSTRGAYRSPQKDGSSGSAIDSLIASLTCDKPCLLGFHFVFKLSQRELSQLEPLNKTAF